MIGLLLKNHFKRNRSNVIKPNVKNITGLLAIGILTVSLLGLLGFILFQITDTFYRLDLGNVYLTIVFLILLIVLTVYEVINIIKQLFQNEDNNIYLKLPVTKESVFISKIIYIYLKQIFVSIAFLAITAGVYGLISHVNIAYYFRLLLISIVLPLLPLSLASILSIPASSLIGRLKRNWKLLLGSLLVLVGLFFVVYIGFVEIILNFINLSSQSSSPVINPEITNSLQNAANKLFISKTFYLMLNNLTVKGFILNFLLIIAIISVLTLGSYFLLKKFYFKALDSQNEKVSYGARQVKKECKPMVSLFKKEFKTLTRNPNYAFQAIVMNILMPIFIFYTIKLSKHAGELAVGEEIVPGITVLTILLFVLLSNGFQGTIISREKSAHYISKIIPVSYFRQIIARISFGYLLSISMLFVSVIAIILAGFVSVLHGLFIFVMAVIFLFGYTFNLVYRDYSNPQLTSNEGGIDEGLNMYNTLLGGLIVAIGLGIINIGLPYIVKLFPHMRSFLIMGFIIIDLTASKVNLYLYGLIFITITVYALVGFFRLYKEVKRT